MKLFVWLTSLCFLLVLKPTASQGTKSFHSSLQRSKRRFACPGESVVYSCATYGIDLMWYVNDNLLKTFSGNDREGTGFSCDDSDAEACPFDQECILFSVVLDNIVSTAVDNDNRYSYCYSTLTITPGQLNENTSVLDQCGNDPDQQFLNISCQVFDQNESDVKYLEFAVAGVPNKPGKYTWQCLQQHSGDLVQVHIGASSSSTTDLNYHEVTLYDLNGNIKEKAMNMSATGTNNICFRIEPKGDTSGITYNISANVSAIDKCGQRSHEASTKSCYDSAPSISCTFYYNKSTMVNVCRILGNTPDYYTVKVLNTVDDVPQKKLDPNNCTDPVFNYKDVQAEATIVAEVTIFYTCWQDTFKFECKSGAMITQPQLEWLYYFLLVCGSSTGLWM